VTGDHDGPPLQLQLLAKHTNNRANVNAGQERGEGRSTFDWLDRAALSPRVYPCRLCLPLFVLFGSIQRQSPTVPPALNSYPSSSPSLAASGSQLVVSVLFCTSPSSAVQLRDTEHSTITILVLAPHHHHRPADLHSPRNRFPVGQEPAAFREWKRAYAERDCIPRLPSSVPGPSPSPSVTAHKSLVTQTQRKH